MKKLILALMLTSFALLNSFANNYSSTEYENAKTNLQRIYSGSNVVDLIDGKIEDFKSNKTKLENLISATERLKSRYDNNSNIVLILEYIELKAKDELQNSAFEIIKEVFNEANNSNSGNE